MSTVVLERFAYSPDGTFGKFIFPTGEEFFSVELPWLGNAVGESCIPEGMYPLVKRYSPVVQRSSNGEFSEGWEVTGVVNRELIMIHPANWPFDVEGCIGTGLSYEVLPSRDGVYRNGVGDSREAFRQMMGLLETSDFWELDVRPRFIEYP